MILLMICSQFVALALNYNKPCEVGYINHTITFAYIFNIVLLFLENKRIFIILNAIYMFIGLQLLTDGRIYCIKMMNGFISDSLFCMLLMAWKKNVLE